MSATPHAYQRAVERYGIELDHDDAANMILQIQEQRGVHLSSRGVSSRVWAVYWRGAHRVVPVVYHKGRHTLLTILPATWKLPDEIV